MKKRLIGLSLCFSLLLPSFTFADSIHEGSRETQEAFVMKYYGMSSEFAKELKDSDLKKLSSEAPVKSNNKEEYFRIERPTFNSSFSTRSSLNSPVVTKISKEEALQESTQASLNEGLISPLGNSDSVTKTTDWLKLETNMTYYTQNGSVSVLASWLKSASSKRKDVLAIGLSNNVAPIKDTASFNHKVELYSPADFIWNSFSDTTADISFQPGGVSAKFDLANPPVAIRNEKAYLTFKVAPREGNTWKTNSLYDTFGYYRHLQKNISLSYGVSIPLGGNISLGSSTSFDEVNSFAQIKFQ
ncbi:hypothetical protein J2Z69_003135 [Paenibacillus shirakamiensis]|uniref:Uncharacterized protein n=1 Tax=Paenibacillus shirakamiensis TaxID=1265935 RepID=A0ABS4JK41_9BACL|nr:hypothetical protein [Paenibacillus shirakamiensis]MBP2002078.1 hypothetical protein [Paenibacillus shirakamiensis]